MEELFNDGIHSCLAYLNTEDWSVAVRTSKRMLSIATHTEPMRCIAILGNPRQFVNKSQTDATTPAPTNTIAHMSLIRHVTEICFDYSNAYPCFLTWSEVFTLQRCIPTLTRFECGIIGGCEEKEEIFFRPSLTRLVFEFLTKYEWRDVIGLRPEPKIASLGQLSQSCLNGMSQLASLTSLTFKDVRSSTLDWSPLMQLHQMLEFELRYTDEDEELERTVRQVGFSHPIVLVINSWSTTLELLHLDEMMRMSDSLPIIAPHVRKTNVYALSSTADELRRLHTSFPSLTQFDVRQSNQGGSFHLPSLRLFTHLQSLMLSKRPHVSVTSREDDDLTIMRELSLISSLTELVFIRWMPPTHECWSVLLALSSPLASSLRSLRFDSMLPSDVLSPLNATKPEAIDVSRLTSLFITDAHFTRSSIPLFSRFTSLTHLTMYSLIWSEDFDYHALYTLLSSSKYMPYAERILIATEWRSQDRDLGTYFDYDTVKKKNRCKFPGQTEEQKILHRTPPSPPLVGIELNPGPSSSSAQSFFKDGLLVIFSYLSLSEVSLSVLPSCRYWMTTSLKERCRSISLIRPSNLVSSLLFSPLRYHLTELNVGIAGEPFPNNNLVEHRGAFQSLEEFHATLLHLPSLRSYTVRLMSMSGLNSSSILSTPLNHINLKELILAFHSRDSPQQHQQVVDWIASSLPPLEIFDLGGVRYDLSLASLATSSSQLHRFDCMINCVDDQDEQLAMVVALSDRLRELASIPQLTRFSYFLDFTIPFHEAHATQHATIIACVRDKIIFPHVERCDSLDDIDFSGFDGESGSQHHPRTIMTSLARSFPSLQHFEPDRMRACDLQQLSEFKQLNSLSLKKLPIESKGDDEDQYDSIDESHFVHLLTTSCPLLTHLQINNRQVHFHAERWNLIFTSMPKLTSLSFEADGSNDLPILNSLLPHRARIECLTLNFSDGIEQLELLAEFTSLRRLRIGGQFVFTNTSLQQLQAHLDSCDYLPQLEYIELSPLTFTPTSKLFLFEYSSPCFIYDRNQEHKTGEYRQRVKTPKERLVGIEPNPGPTMETLDPSTLFISMPHLTHLPLDSYPYRYTSNTPKMLPLLLPHRDLIHELTLELSSFEREDIHVLFQLIRLIGRDVAAVFRGITFNPLKDSLSSPDVLPQLGFLELSTSKTRASKFASPVREPIFFVDRNQMYKTGDYRVQGKPPASRLVGVELNPGPPIVLLTSSSTVASASATSLFTDGFILIFSYLTLGELASSVPSVCQSWHSAAQRERSRNITLAVPSNRIPRIISSPLRYHITTLIIRTRQHIGSDKDTMDIEHRTAQQTITEFCATLRTLPSLTSFATRICHDDPLMDASASNEVIAVAFDIASAAGSIGLQLNELEIALPPTPKIQQHWIDFISRLPQLTCLRLLGHASSCNLSSLASATHLTELECHTLHTQTLGSDNVRQWCSDLKLIPHLAHLSFSTHFSSSKNFMLLMHAGLSLPKLLKWHELKGVELSHSNDQDCMKKIHHAFPSLTHLSPYGFRESDIQHLALFKQLNSLALCHPTIEFITSFVDYPLFTHRLVTLITVAVPQLTHLHLGLRVLLYADDWHRLFNSIPHLQHLSFDGYIPRRDVHVSAILPLLIPHRGRIHELTLECGSSPIKEKVDDLIQLTSLRRLTVRNVNPLFGISADTMKDQLASIAVLPELEYLELSHENYDPKRLKLYIPVKVSSFFFDKNQIYKTGDYRTQGKPPSPRLVGIELNPGPSTCALLFTPYINIISLR